MRVGLVVFVAILAVLATIDASGSASPTDEFDPEAEAILGAIQEHSGVSRELAVEIAAFEERFSIFATDLQHRYQNNFAGAWIDHDAGGVLVVAMVDPSEARLDIPPDLDGRAQFVEVERSLDELQAIADDLNESIDEGMGGASPDIENNGIWIEILDTAMATFRRDEGPTAKVIQLQDLGVAVTYLELDALPKNDRCDSAYRCNPLVAGAAIRGPDFCSAGFKVKRVSTGKNGMLTAKHCGAGSYEHWIYDNALTSNGGLASPSADVRFLKKGSSSLTLADDVYSFGSLRDMSGWGTPVLNQVVCRGGRRSSDCGTVVNTAYRGYRFRVKNMAACVGDSGSPHYLGSTAYGTHTGSTDVEDCPGPDNETSNAVHIAAALNHMALKFVSTHPGSG